MTPETNKLIIRRFTEELINTAGVTLAAELIAPNASLLCARNARAAAGTGRFPLDRRNDARRLSRHPVDLGGHGC